MDDFVYFRLRLPTKLKKTIEKEAKKNNRSMNSEILSMIQNNNTQITDMSVVVDYLFELQNMHKTMVKLSNQFTKKIGKDKLSNQNKEALDKTIEKNKEPLHKEDE